MNAQDNPTESSHDSSPPSTPPEAKRKQILLVEGEPLTRLIWIASILCITTSFGMSWLLIRDLSVVVEGVEPTLLPHLWWQLAAIISCGTLAAVLIPEFTKVFTSSHSKHVHEIVTASREGGASLTIALAVASTDRLPALLAQAPAAAQSAPAGRVDESLFTGLRWRSIGPARGGRSQAAAGSSSTGPAHPRSASSAYAAGTCGAKVGNGAGRNSTPTSSPAAAAPAAPQPGRQLRTAWTPAAASTASASVAGPMKRAGVRPIVTGGTRSSSA